MSSESQQLDSTEQDKCGESIKRLQSGEMDPRSFLNAIFARDQSDGARSGAGENSEILNDPRVVEIFSAQPEYQAEFENARSLSVFHVAQQKLAENDYEAAEPYLVRALDFARAANWGPEYDGWRNYLAGTLAYARGDRDGFEFAVKMLASDPAYLDVLVRLRPGMITPTERDYRRDYGGQS